MFRKTVAILMAGVCLCGTVACSSGGNSTTATGTVATAFDTAEETEAVRAKDNIPALDMGGVTVSILVRENEKDEFAAEASGDVIDDEVYKRNLKTEERFNCSMNYIVQPGNWAAQATYKELIRSAVTAGDSVYDIVTGQSNIVQPLNFEGMYVNLLNVKYLDFTQPYWLDSYTEGMNLTGQVCTVCGDIALSTFSEANVIFFNKKIMEDNNLPYPYEDVLNGKWTLDKMLTLCETVTKDLNGDGVITVEDCSGYSADSNALQPFFSSCGFRYTQVDKEGNRTLLTPSDALTTTADKVNNLVHSNYFVKARETTCDDFKANKFLFVGMTLSKIEVLRDMEVDFGIIPFPKNDENQEEYYTTILRRYTVSAIPLTATNADYSSAILESMSCDGCNSIIPKYYDIALIGKYFRDEASRDMLDIIKDSLFLEFVDLYYNDLGFSDIFASYALNSSAGTYMSTFEKNKQSWAAKLEKLYEVKE